MLGIRRSALYDSSRLSWWSSRKRSRSWSVVSIEPPVLLRLGARHCRWARTMDGRRVPGAARRETALGTLESSERAGLRPARRVTQLATGCRRVQAGLGLAAGAGV